MTEVSAPSMNGLSFLVVKAQLIQLKKSGVWKSSKYCGRIACEQVTEFQV